jgi:hypothetical protein
MHEPDAPYFSMLLKQEMRASGKVCVCKTTGFVHVCDETCQGTPTVEGAVCMYTGVCKDACMKLVSPFDDDRETTDGGVTRLAKRGAWGPSMICNINLPRKRMYGNGHDDSDDMMGVDHGRTFVPNHVDFMMNRSNETLDAQRQEFLLQQTIQELRNIRRCMLLPAERQVEKQTQLLSGAQLRLAQARQRTERVIQNTAKANPPQPHGPYDKISQRTVFLEQLMKKAYEVFGVLFRYHNAAIKALSHADKVNAAFSQMGDYIRTCIRDGETPHYVTGLSIAMGAYQKLAVMPPSNLVLERERYLAELCIYYWKQFQPRFCVHDVASSSMWLKEAKQFMLSFVYMMHHGMVVEMQGVTVQVIPFVPFVMENMCPPNTIQGRDSNKNSLFENQDRIRKIIAMAQLEDPSFIEAISYEKADAHARREQQIYKPPCK